MKRLLILLSVFIPVLCSATGIKVSTQEEFDALGKRILYEISRGESRIDIDIMPGQYFFDEGHLSIVGKKCGNLQLSITGHDAVITGRGEKGRFCLDAGYVSLKDRTDVPLFTSLREALSKAEILDASTGLCRLAVDEKAVKESKAEDMYILITQWYLAKKYKVQKIEDGFVYFFAPGAEDSTSAEKSPNSDYNYGKRMPRYAILNSPGSMVFSVKKNGKIRAQSRKNIVRCDAGSFLKISGGEIGSVSVKGICFLGAGGPSPLIFIYRVNVNGGVEVRNCSFDGIRGDVMRITASRAVSFKDNLVRNCYSNGVVSDKEAKGTVVKGNKFFNTGLNMGNYFGVVCRGEDFLVADNLFRDFVYGAIGVGAWYKSSGPHNCSGIIENNECCFSPDYASGIPFNLMDSGAIYTWTINKDVTIRSNYVHDIFGPGQNRGIFCDDGAVNVKIVGNRVERISNSFCIDLRRVLSIETAAGSMIKKVNVGNEMRDNAVDGRVRFEGRDK